MKYNDFELRVLNQYSMHTKQGLKQISPAVIAMIIDIALRLLSNCSNLALRRRPVLARVIIRQHMTRAELSRPDSHDIVETIADLAAGATDDELKTLANMNFE